MPTAREILSEKQAEIVSVSPDATVLDATRIMNQHHIGALIVLEEGDIAGIFTERDVLQRVSAIHRP